MSKSTRTLLICSRELLLMPLRPLAGEQVTALRCMQLKNMCLRHASTEPLSAFTSKLALPLDREVRPKPASELYERMQKLIGSGRTYKSFNDPKVMDRTKLMKMVAASQAELPVRHLADSYDEAIIAIGSSDSTELRSRYQTAFDTARIGRLLEDLDGFAVWLAYKHNLNPRAETGLSPLVIVTALVDRLDIHDNVVIHADRDIKFCGQITWVGASSCEALIKVYQKQTNEADDNDFNSHHILDARFVLVARDPFNRGKAYLNPLAPANEHERILFEHGQQNHERRRRAQEQSVYKIPPNEQERQLIHDMFLHTYMQQNERNTPWSVNSAQRKPIDAGSGAVWMRDTVLSTTQLCHPEFRNTYDKIFGGFLMREAFELAWCNANILCRARPHAIAIDDIMFRTPVDIGSILLTTSTVIYTHDRFMQTQVVAEVHHPQTNERQITNVFYFTFAADEGSANTVPAVVPESYAEHMAYIMGKRHFDEAMYYQQHLRNSSGNGSNKN